MKRSANGSQVLVIGDGTSFGSAIRALLETHLSFTDAIRYTTYDNADCILTPRVIRETDLFVLELWRMYPTGLRAEGIAVAEQLARLGMVSLIVSPLYCAQLVPSLRYWDLASQDCLPARCKGLLAGRALPPGENKTGLDPLRMLLSRFLPMPSAHEYIQEDNQLSGL